MLQQTIFKKKGGDIYIYLLRLYDSVGLHDCRYEVIDGKLKTFALDKLRPKIVIIGRNVKTTGFDDSPYEYGKDLIKNKIESMMSEGYSRLETLIEVINPKIKPTTLSAIETFLLKHLKETVTPKIAVVKVMESIPRLSNNSRRLVFPILSQPSIEGVRVTIKLELKTFGKDTLFEVTELTPIIRNINGKEIYVNSITEVFKVIFKNIPINNETVFGYKKQNGGKIVVASKDLIFDGYIYNKELSLPEIIRAAKGSTKDTSNLVFYCCDIILTKVEQIERLRFIKYLFSYGKFKETDTKIGREYLYKNNTNLIAVTSRKLISETNVNECFAFYVKEGFNGQVFRAIDAFYNAKGALMEDIKEKEVKLNNNN